MITYTLGFPGFLFLERRKHLIDGEGFYGYLSAYISGSLGKGEVICSHKWNFDGKPISEQELRRELEKAIKRYSELPACQ